MSQSRTFTLAVDPELHHGREPEDEFERITWETLDTVWNLLRESAARLIVAEISAKRHGDSPTDEELLAAVKAAGTPEGFTVDLAAEGLLAVFETLVGATADAAFGGGDLPLLESGE